MKLLYSISKLAEVATNIIIIHFFIDTYNWQSTFIFLATGELLTAIH